MVLVLLMLFLFDLQKALGSFTNWPFHKSFVVQEKKKNLWKEIKCKGLEYSLKPLHKQVLLSYNYYCFQMWKVTVVNTGLIILTPHTLDLTPWYIWYYGVYCKNLIKLHNSLEKSEVDLLDFDGFCCSSSSSL